jgi:hypothetical protein
MGVLLLFLLWTAAHIYATVRFDSYQLLHGIQLAGYIFACDFLTA